MLRQIVAATVKRFTHSQVEVISHSHRRLLHSAQYFGKHSVIMAEPKKIGTHNGIFHCDEILAIFMLQQLPEYENTSIVRTRDDSVLADCDIVVDVGSIFDPVRLRFDHHQKTFQHTLSSLRPELGDKWSKVRLSSAGLIYAHFGEKVIRQILKQEKGVDATDECLRKVYEKVYDNFVEEMDGIDNGVPQFADEPVYRISTDLCSRVGAFNQQWNSLDDFDEMGQFEKAKTLVGAEFTDKVLYFGTVWWPARAIVDEAICKRHDILPSGEIIELSQMCPWKQHLFDLEKEHGIEGQIKYCVSASSPEDWRVISVSVTASSFVCRKFLPEPWRGLRDDQLRDISGVCDATFCHATGFIGGAKSRKSALQMASNGLELKLSPCDEVKKPKLTP